MNQVRILHCIIGSMNIGGIETVLMEVYRRIDKEKFQFDFVVHDKRKNVFEDEINMLGGVLYRVDFFSKHPFRHVQQFDRLLLSHTEYDIIHIHTTYSIMLPDALLGKLRRCKVIIHSHNASAAIKRRVVHKLFKYPFDALADYRVACSDLAAQWMFTQNHMNEVFYWYNAFNMSRFQFSEESRKKLRDKCGVSDGFVIGNVGRLSYQKNQTFLLKIFNEIQKRCDKAVLWLVGDGEDRDCLEKLSMELGIRNKVMFWGSQSCVEKFLCAMDVYVCTSRYEGLGISLVEAQVTGLPVVAMGKDIPACVKVLKDYITIDEEVAASQWAEAVLQYQNYYIDRDEAYKQALFSKFNIDMQIKYVEEFYLHIING